jgi:hypothetical protein
LKAVSTQIKDAGVSDTTTGSQITEILSFAAEGAGNLMNNFIGSSLDSLINGAISLNEFFGGSLTMNPMPVRLTMGHILDIEPLVITNVSIKGSKEQFMTDDGSNIPLFLTANISFDMWMNPDPNKGYLRWLGDDIFNGGYFSVVSDKGSDTVQKAH